MKKLLIAAVAAAAIAGGIASASTANATPPCPVSRLGLVADKFGVPWMVVSQNVTG